MQQVTIQSAVSEEFKSYAWRDPEVITIHGKRWSQCLCTTLQARKSPSFQARGGICARRRLSSECP